MIIVTRSLPLVAALLLPYSISMAAEDAYEPFVKKTPPTTKIIVLDIEKEKLSCEDALETIACIQGLVNRTSSEKIFIRNVPFRCYFDVEKDHPRNASRTGPGNPFDYMLEELLPVPKEYPELDQSKEAPALDYLLTHYADLVKGKVVYDSPQAAAGQLSINTAIFEDGIVVTPKVDEIIESWGYNFPELADYSDVKDHFEGHRISMEKYFDHPERNDRTVGFGATAVMLDYHMATRTFCTFFDKRDFDAAGREEAEKLMVDLFERYPPGIPVAGYIEITQGHHSIKDGGLQPVCGELPNASVTSSMPSVPSEFHAEKPGEALEIDPNGVYITWYGVDIDAIDFSLLVYKSLRNDPKVGQAPLFIKMTPFFVDWFPTYFEWLSKLAPDQIDFFYSPYGDGPPPETTRNTAAHYIANSNGAFGSHEVAPETQLPIFELTGGYTGNVGDHSSTWSSRQGTVWASKLGGMRLGPKNPHPYDPDVDVMVDNVKKSILEYSEPGKPYFIVGRVPTECGIDIFTMLVEAQDRLKADPDILRNLYFVRPFDIAATFKAYDESGAAKQAAKPFTGDAMAALASEDASERRLAVRALLDGEIDADQSTELTEAFAVEVNPAAKRLLALAIGRIGAPAEPAIPALSSTLGDETVGPAAAKALSQIGRPALDSLVSALQTGEPVAKINAGRGIGWLGPEAVAASRLACSRLLRNLPTPIYPWRSSQRLAGSATWPRMRP